MFKPTKGKTERIYKVDCHLPEQPPLHEIDGFELPKEEQMWRRQELPQFHISEIEIWSGDSYEDREYLEYDEARREEEIRQSGFDPWDTNSRKKQICEPDPSYFIESLEDYRQVEIDRCNPWSGGHWFMNNGVPTYLTPFHYFYLQWWPLGDGYPEYRDADRKKFYYWQWVFENPSATGMTEASKRGEGKTYRAACVAYLVTIYTRNCWSGIQSKTDDDAKDVFTKHIAEPYKRLPDFFVPINKNPSDPQSSLQFFAPSAKGKNAAYARKLQREALSSKIDYRASNAKSYDGKTINGILILDEEGKTEVEDVYRRHTIVKNCVYRDGKLKGKIYSTTTVDVLDKGGKEYKKVWDNSDPEDTNEYGWTKLGLFRYFMPAYETEFFDKYGNSVAENPTPEQSEYLKERYGIHAAQGAKPYQAAIRKQLESDPQALLQFTLQQPWTEEELFSAAGHTCQYDLFLLRNQERLYCNDSKNSAHRVGKFRFTDGFGSEVVWEDDPKGHWNVVWLFEDPEKANNVRKTKRSFSYSQKRNRDISLFDYIPLNTVNFTAGFDPTKSGEANEDKRRSSAAGTIFRKKDLWDEENSETWVADFKCQPDDPFEVYLEFIAGCFYYGCEVLVERNLGIPEQMFKDYGIYAFLMKRPEETYSLSSSKRAQKLMVGIPSNKETNDYQLKVKKAHLGSFHAQSGHGHKLKLPRIIEDSIKFDPKYRTRHDMEVASQLSLVAAQKYVADQDEDTIDLGQLFGSYDNTGLTSRQL